MMTIDPIADTVSTEQFQLPLTLARAEIERSIHSRIASIKQRIGAGSPVPLAGDTARQTSADSEVW